MMTYILYFLNAVLFYSPDYILIEHIGESDKPINSIFISKKVLDQKNSFIVKEETFYNFKRLILISKSNKTNNIFQFGTFNFKIYENNTINCFNLDRINSIQLFDRLLTNLKDVNDNGRLIQEIENIKKRITF